MQSKSSIDCYLMKAHSDWFVRLVRSIGYFICIDIGIGDNQPPPNRREILDDFIIKACNSWHNG
jgi:hypothetical protein